MRGFIGFGAWGFGLGVCGLGCIRVSKTSQNGQRHGTAQPFFSLLQAVLWWVSVSGLLQAAEHTRIEGFRRSNEDCRVLCFLLHFAELYAFSCILQSVDVELRAACRGNL